MGLNNFSYALWVLFLTTTIAIFFRNETCRQLHPCMMLKHAMFNIVKRSKRETKCPIITRYMWGMWDPEPLGQFHQKTISANNASLNPEKSIVHNKFDVLDAVTVVDRAVPDFLHVYLSVPRKICRADLGRYALIYLYGGLYMDVDVEITDPSVFDSLDSPVFFFEKDGLLPSSRKQVANYAFYAPRKSVVVKQIIETCVFRCRTETDRKWSDDDVLEFTGPRAVTQVVLNHLATLRVETHGVAHSRLGSWRLGKDQSL